MVSLLFVVDAWYEIATRNDPTRFSPADRVEMLGRLVRLVSRCFDGFDTIPASDAIAPAVTSQWVGLCIRLSRPVPADLNTIAEDLAHYGFSLGYDPDHAKLTLRCDDTAGIRLSSDAPRRTRSHSAARR